MFEAFNKSSRNVQMLKPVIFDFDYPFHKFSSIVNVNILTLTWRVIFRILIHNPLTLFILEEMINTVEKYACYRLINTYDTSLDFISVFISELWWNFAFGSSINPSIYIERLILEDKNVTLNLAALTQQFFSGCILWKLRSWIQVQDEYCLSPLQVATMPGTLIEGTLAFVDRLINVYLKKDFIKYMGFFPSCVLSAFTTTVIFAIGIRYTGGNFNPVLSHVLYYSCEGHTTSQFIVVYWISPVLGGIVAHSVYNIL